MLWRATLIAGLFSVSGHGSKFSKNSFWDCISKGLFYINTEGGLPHMRIDSKDNVHASLHLWLCINMDTLNASTTFLVSKARA